MFYIVTRFNIAVGTGKETHSQQRYEKESAAYKRYYSILASDIESDSYIYELVQIVRSDGICIASQVFEEMENGNGNA